MSSRTEIQKRLHGSLVALVTPFKKGKVDEAGLRRQIRYQIDGGTRGLVPCGTTGESPTLSHEEHKRVIAIAVETSGGRIPVVAGAGSNSTQEAVDLTRFAAKKGANAVLSVVPYYNKPTQEGLFRHFEAIAKRSSIPIVLYNIPGRCGTGLTAQTVKRLSRIDLIVGIKEATGSMDMASEVIAETDLTLLSGDDSLTLPLLSLGGKGVISVVANLFPTDLQTMIDAFFKGQLDRALKLHQALFGLVKSLFIETNPIPVKQAMKLMRRDSGELRLPLCPMQPGNLALVKEALQKYQSVRRGFFG